MLSVLIPIYQVKVEKLVRELRNQCLAAKIEFEILCFDDCSSVSVRQANRAIDSILGVNYVELSENKGRAKIRNLLARSARFDYLLFIDADSKISRKTFIKTYVHALVKDSAICGGRFYASKQPSRSKLLHWKYGRARESKKASIRSRKKVELFHSNNFVIDRKVMYENWFDEEINGYGYEDLAFANKLSQRHIKIIHIDNPLIHNKLEDVETFLAKTIEATENLYNLYRLGKVPRTRLIKAYKLIDSYYLNELFLSMYARFSQRIETNLRSSQMNLFYLDLYKLNHFLTLVTTDRTEMP